MVTSCFIDVILIPLCTWLYLLAFITALILKARRRKHLPQDERFIATSRKSETLPSPASNSLGVKPRKKLRVVLFVVYCVLLFAQGCMCTLELVRLGAASLGIGLLPFTYVTLIVALALHWKDGVNGNVTKWRWLNVGVWLALLAMAAVKIAEEVKEGVHTRERTRYPMVDQVTDVAVMMGVYAVLAILDCATIAKRWEQG